MKKQIQLQLVCEEAEVVDILHKFEDRAFIHQYINCTAHGHHENEIEQLELPRVNMAFTRKSGQWMSRDYRGYCLADNQKMSDTLIDFDSYLVLKKVDPNARCSVNLSDCESQRHTKTMSPRGFCADEQP